MTRDRAYPADPRGDLDAGVPKQGDMIYLPICCKRITHDNVSKYETAITWCTQPEGHEGQCSGPLPSILEPNDLGPAGLARRRR